MPGRQYMFVEKKKEENISKQYLKVSEIMKCLNGMYEALHTSRKEQQAQQFTLSSCLSADLTNTATRVSQWL